MRQRFIALVRRQKRTAPIWIPVEAVLAVEAVNPNKWSFRRNNLPTFYNETPPSGTGMKHASYYWFTIAHAFRIQSPMLHLRPARSVQALLLFLYSTAVSPFYFRFHCHVRCDGISSVGNSGPTCP